MLLLSAWFCALDSVTFIGTLGPFNRPPAPKLLFFETGGGDWLLAVGRRLSGMMELPVDHCIDFWQASKAKTTAVSEIPCPIKAIFRVVASWGRDDLAAVNADTPFPKPL
jgi:hypothetical protein